MLLVKFAHLSLVAGNHVESITVDDGHVLY